MFNNHACNRTQGGRSMLEMLAVLGLVGILTLTALFGYRYAMAASKSQRAFKDVMLRSTAIASSASFEQIQVGENIKPLGYNEESGGMTYTQTKLDDDSYKISVSAFNDLACQKLLDMDYKETPVKAIELVGFSTESTPVENLRNADLAAGCKESGNEVVYYFDRTTGLLGTHHGGNGSKKPPVECSCSGDNNVGVCEIANINTCGCLSSVSYKAFGTRCYTHGVCNGQGGCICDRGYYGDGQNCTLCPPNTYRDTAGATKVGQCLPCPENSHASDDRTYCICNEGSVWDKANNRCATTCTQDGWNNSECNAKDARYPDCYIAPGQTIGYCMCHGFHNNEKKCVRCNESAGAKVRVPWYSKVLTLCDCVRPDKTWRAKSNACRCPPDTYDNGSACVACGPGSHRPDEKSESQCICDDPLTVWNPQTNTCDDTRTPCKKGGRDSEDCKNTNGTYPDCYIEPGKDSGYCMCEGFHNDSKKCVRCSENAGAKIRVPWYSPVLTLCDCKDINAIWQAKTNSCVCKDNHYRNEYTQQQCKPCVSGSTRLDEHTCVCEDKETIWNPQTNTCDSDLTPCKKAGRDSEDCKNTNGTYPDCYIAPGQDTGYCMCYGFHNDKKVCIRCNENAGAIVSVPWKNPPKLTLCMCEDIGKVWDAKTNSCVGIKCEENYYFDGTQCVLCGPGSHRALTDPEDRCICDDASEIWDSEINACHGQACMPETEKEDCTDPAYPTCYTKPDGENICACLGWHDDKADRCIACDEKGKGPTVATPWDAWLYKPDMSGCFCPEHSQFVSGQCVCDEGYVWNPNTLKCDPPCQGVWGTGCDDTFRSACGPDFTPSVVSGNAGDSTITVKYCSVGSTPGNDGKGCIVGTVKTVTMYRQKMKNGGEFYASGTPASWYDAQMICAAMPGYKNPKQEIIRLREHCRHPRRVRSALKQSNGSLAGPNVPRRLWDVNLIDENGQCLANTIDVRSGVIQNEYKQRKAFASESTFVSGTHVIKAGGKKIWVDGGAMYPVCYRDISGKHCDDDNTSDDPE